VPAAGGSIFSGSWVVADAFNSIDNPATSKAEAADEIHGLNQRLVSRNLELQISICI
jgi:hypothetical protein